MSYENRQNIRDEKNELIKRNLNGWTNIWGRRNGPAKRKSGRVRRLGAAADL